MRVFDREEQLHWIEMGQGPAVILVHGMAASRRDWESWLPRLAQDGLRLIAPDLPGHGASPKPDNPSAYRLPAVYTAFESWLRDLDLGQPFAVVGHSLGGYFCLELCRRRPEWIGKLVLINPLFRASQLSPGGRLLQSRPDLWAGLLEMTPSWLLEKAVQSDPLFLNDLSVTLRRQAAENLREACPQIIHLLRDVPDLTPWLARIRTPTLLIWGMEDRTLEPDSFPELAARLPNLRERALPGCGHQPHLAQPERVIQLVKDFLRIGLTN